MKKISAFLPILLSIMLFCIAFGSTLPKPLTTSLNRGPTQTTYANRADLVNTVIPLMITTDSRQQATGALTITDAFERIKNGSLNGIIVSGNLRVFIHPNCTGGSLEVNGFHHPFIDLPLGKRDVIPFNYLRVESPYVLKAVTAFTCAATTGQ